MVTRISLALVAIAVTPVQPHASAQKKESAPAPRQEQESKKAALAPERFDSLVRLILPDAERGETKWTDVAWMTDTLAARKKAAAEDKPIVVWTMSACPLGGD